MPVFAVIASGEVAVTAMLVGGSDRAGASSAAAKKVEEGGANTSASGADADAGNSHTQGKKDRHGHRNGLLLYTLREADVLATSPIGFSNAAAGHSHARSSSVGRDIGGSSSQAAGAVQTFPSSRAPPLSKSASMPSPHPQTLLGR